MKFSLNFQSKDNNVIFDLPSNLGLNNLDPNDEQLKNILIRMKDSNHVMSDFKDSYRKIDNWLGSNIFFLDIDNDDSDNKEEWETSDNHIFREISSYIKDNLEAVIITESKSSNIEKSHGKDNIVKIARPKFHVLVLLKTYYTDLELYKEDLKDFIYNVNIKGIDKKVNDVSRMFYPSNSKSKIIVYRKYKTAVTMFKVC